MCLKPKINQVNGKN